MNWQLLIKMLSFPLCRPEPLSFRGNRQTESSFSLSLSPSVSRKRRGPRRRGRFQRQRDAVSILFVHANYSSWVTLLEIEGAESLSFLFLLGRARPLSSSLPWGFPNGPRVHPLPLRRPPLSAPSRGSVVRHLSSVCRSETSVKRRGSCAREDFNFSVREERFGRR